MFIPNSMPNSLSSMLEFMQPTVESGLFDQVAYDNESTPSKIVCVQGGNTILEMGFNSISDVWTFTPFKSAGAASSTHIFNGYALGAAVRCSGGVYFRSTGQGQGQTHYEFVIGKLNSGKTGFVYHQAGQNMQLGSSSYFRFYPSSYDDNASVGIYSNGYQIATNYTADRTILSTVPVAGAAGSTDYFTTVFVRNVVQFIESGTQLIDGVKYYCDWYFAILDT